MKKIAFPVLCLAFALTSCLTVHAQTFLKTYGGGGQDIGYDVWQTTDGGYITVGSTSLGAGNGDVYLVKTSSNGTIQWTKAYGGSGLDVGYSVQQTSDGGYIITGYTESFGAGLADLFVIRTDTNGDMLWSTTLGGSQNDLGVDVLQLTTGAFIVVGLTRSYGAGNEDIYVAFINISGNVSWTKVFGSTGVDVAMDVEQRTNNTCTITGQTALGAGSSAAFLIEIDLSGNINWSKTYGGNSSDVGFGIDQHPSGYVIAGETNSFGAGSRDFYLINTDASGNLIWSKTYGTTSFDRGTSVWRTTDGGFAIVGYSSYNGADQLYLVKTDINGGYSWSKSYSPVADEPLYSVQQTTDGGYAMASTYVVGNYIKSLLIKTDASGNVGCNQSTPPTIVNNPSTIVNNIAFTINSGGTQTNPSTIQNNINSNENSVALSLNISPTVNVLCNGNCDGWAKANASGGVSPYAYLWSNSQTVATSTGLCATNYTVTITDDNNCTETQPVTITEPSALSASATANNTTCEATANPIGGISPYAYNWGPSAGNQTTQTATGLCDGTYTVTISDNNNCTTTAIVIVVDVPEITLYQSLNIYPNPNSGEFTIEMELTKPQEMEMELLNVIGQVVYKEGLGKVSGAYQKQLDLNYLAKGIYTLKLISEEGTTTRKIILK